jgi:hypothetical protein
LQPFASFFRQEKPIGAAVVWVFEEYDESTR